MMMKADAVSKAALRPGAWIAVCDGTRALLLVNKGDRVSPKLETRAAMTAPAPSTHELGSAKPGRVFSAIDERRSATEETDFHLQAESQFIRQFADCIESNVRQATVPTLVLIAPPRSLGLLRNSLRTCTRHILGGRWRETMFTCHFMRSSDI